MYVNHNKSNDVSNNLLRPPPAKLASGKQNRGNVLVLSGHTVIFIPSYERIIIN